MSLIWMGPDKPKACEVCGGKENVCRSSLYGVVCGRCLMDWIIPMFYGAVRQEIALAFPREAS